jgi:hypothetical protein
LVFAASAAATPETYWVSPTGADTNSGAYTAPFATIQHCANVVSAGDTCLIESGTYHETVTPPTSGTSSAPITFAAAPGATVTISGADSISSSAWSAVPDTSYYEANVDISSAALGPPDPDTPEDTPDQSYQVFDTADGVTTQMEAARWPATGTDLMRPTLAVAGADSAENCPSGVCAGGTVYDASIPSVAGGWTNATITIWAGQAFEAQTGTVTGSSSGQVTYSGADAECGSASEYHNVLCGSGYSTANDSFYLSGVLGALQSPGQWYYDSSTDELYFWAPGGGSPGGSVSVKQREYAFDLSGDSYINVNNIGIFAASVNTSASSSHDTLNGLTAEYVSQFDTIPVKYEETDNVGGADLLNTGLILAGTYNELENSSINWSAGNGVSVQGTYDTVTNNLIHDVDYMGTFASGVYIEGQNDTVTANTIYDTGGDGIVGAYDGNGIFSQYNSVLDFTDNDISYNNIFGYGMLNQDEGGIYSCCRENATGGSVDHNWLHDSADDDTGARSVGVYLDAGSENFLVHHNVVWNTGGIGLRINGDDVIPDTEGRAQDDLIDNNTFGPGNYYSVAGPQFEEDTTGTVFTNNIFQGVYNWGTVFPNNLPPTTGGEPTNPEYQSSSGGDLRLTSTSPAVDAGTAISGITNGYVGAAPDEGGYEYAGQQWVPGCNFVGCSFPNDSAHSVDDAASSLTGTGWTSCTSVSSPPDPDCDAGAGDFDGSITTSDTAGDTLTLSFTGDQVQLYGSRDANGGLGEVSIDGVPLTTVSWYMYQVSPSTAFGDTVLYTSPVLSEGAHTLTVTVTGTPGLGGGAWVNVDRIAYSQAPTTTTTVDDYDTGTYTGDWTHCTSGCDADFPPYDAGDFYDGTVSYDQDGGDTFSYTFDGTGISLTGYTSPNAGIGAISIDGGSPSYVDWYSTGDVPGVQLYSIQGLPDGSHTFTLTVTGHHTAGAESYINIDSLTVSAPVAPVATIDDATEGVADQSWNYVGSGWIHCSMSCDTEFGGPFDFNDATISYDSTSGDTAFLYFTGTSVTVYGLESTAGATGSVTLDNESPQTTSWNTPETTLEPVYTSPILPWGHHSLLISVPGPSDRYVNDDDAVIAP